jgi:hypothetical protein
VIKRGADGWELKTTNVARFAVLQPKGLAPITPPASFTIDGAVVVTDTGDVAAGPEGGVLGTEDQPELQLHFNREDDIGDDPYANTPNPNTAESMVKTSRANRALSNNAHFMHSVLAFGHRKLPLPRVIGKPDGIGVETNMRVI